MSDTATPTTELRIRRGRSGEPGRWETFAVAFRPDTSVLDALTMVRREQDPTLAFRYACINANVCKECVMLIDGVRDYACTTRLKPGSMTIEPLPNKALLQDLVTDLVPPREKL